MRRARLTALATLAAAVAAAAAAIALPKGARADDTVFDFVAPRPDQQGAYAPGAGAVVAGGVGTLTAIPGWLDEAWEYRRPLTVQNGEAFALDEWPVQLLLDAAGDPAAAELFAAADPLGNDLRIVDAGATLPLVTRGAWSGPDNRGVFWFRPPALAPGTTSFELYYGNHSASAIDDPIGVFTYSSPVVTQYTLHPAGTPLLLASPWGADWSVGGAGGTLVAGGSATVDATMWSEGDGVASTGPVQILVDADGATEGVPLSFAATLHEVVVSAGTPSRFTMLSAFADTTVTISIDGVATGSVDLTAGVSGSWVGTVTAGAIVTLSAGAPILAAYRGDDLAGAFVLAPPSPEVVGLRSGTPRIHAVGGDATVTVWDSADNITTVSVPANGSVALTAGGSGTGTTLAQRLRAVDPVTGDPRPITVVANNDGDGADALAYHPLGELGHAFVVPRDGYFVLLATTGTGTSCTHTRPDGTSATLTAATTLTPPFPGRIFFGSTTAQQIDAGSVFTCDAPAFAYFEEYSTLSGRRDEHNLSPIEAHRKRTAIDPTAALGSPVETRYSPGAGIPIDTPELVAPTGVLGWNDFRVATDDDLATEVSYLLSIDGGATWLTPLGGVWSAPADPTAGVTAIEIADSLLALPNAGGRLRVRAVLRSLDGVARPSIDSIRVFYDAAGAPDRIVWDPVPSPITSGQSIQAGITVTDGMGNTLTGAAGDVTLYASHGGAVTPDRVTLVDGRASFSIAIAGVGDDVTLHASGQGASGFSLPFDLVAPAGSLLELVSGDGQYCDQGTLLPDPFVVRAVDPSGVPLGNVQVTFAVVDGGGSLEPQSAGTISVATDQDGLARAWLRAGTPGTQRVRAGALGQDLYFFARSDPPSGSGSGDSGCGCRAARAPGHGAAVLLAFLGAIALLLRRRR